MVHFCILYALCQCSCVVSARESGRMLISWCRGQCLERLVNDSVNVYVSPWWKNDVVEKMLNVMDDRDGDG